MESIDVPQEGKRGKVVASPNHFGPYLKEWRKLKDKRYHLPLEGSRIFIRVWQQVNGFENEAGMFLGNALVPARTWPGWAGKKRQQ